ncbi:MAG: iron-containing alcohol dehydrogenase, partial [Desulfovibrio sp.]|nr:iron-containing alcohol dehydrogenase [Desulfovibrio sp.]
DQIAGHLRKSGIEYCEYDKVLPNPPDYQVQEATELARDFKSNAIVSVGGGSPMDTAKAVNILLSNPSTINAYDGMNTVKNPVGPHFAIPTTAGTGSEVTGVSVITDPKAKKKMVIFGANVAPSVALVDPELTLKLPPDITASTGMDALTHALEAYISTLASPVTDPLALESARTIMRGLRRAYRNGNDIEARSDMLLGSTLAGLCFSNTCLGLAHSMAHPMGAYCNVPHGVGNAVALPYVMEYNAPAISPEKLSRIGEVLSLAVTGKTHEETGKAISAELSALAAELNIPRIRDIGVPKDLIPTLARAALDELSTQTTPRKPTAEDVETLFEAAW